MIKVFEYRFPCGGEMEDLNSWIASHRIVSLKHHIVQSDGAAFLVFVIEYLAPQKKKEPERSTKIDYKDVLSDGAFQRFNHLRAVRKQMSEEQGVPVYTIFTNAQLAEMAELPEISESALKKIAGVGDARIEKYAQPFLKLSQETQTESKQ